MLKYNNAKIWRFMYIYSILFANLFQINFILAFALFLSNQDIWTKTNNGVTVSH